ncbi:MAG TPA: KR domain-containing protein [Aeromonadales bacterium]|nr:KR domain-containing protein [Aeromonadales bacterium]
MNEINRVLIIGGYGNFGQFIARELVKETNIQLVVAGRNLKKAQQFATVLNQTSASSDLQVNYQVEAAYLDINKNLPEVLATISPQIVIHTSGPFQSQSYHVAESCIAAGCHYIDLADGREFVIGISSLHQQAVKNKVSIISGASSVPCLTSALLDDFKAQFRALERVDYGITTAQKTTRGLATTAAILGYTGKAFETLIDGKMQTVYGWQDLHSHQYKKLGKRLLGNCDVPDLGLFSQRYPELKTIRFYAGLEIKFIHRTLWFLSWLVRLGLIRNLQRWAPFLLRSSFLFDFMGSDKSGFHMIVSATDKKGQPAKITFELTAASGDGPYIPCMPAILLTRKLLQGQIDSYGAFPCMGFISKDEYLNALTELDIHWEQSGQVTGSPLTQ